MRKLASRNSNINKTQSGGSIRDWLDKHYEWRKFLKSELISKSTFKHRSFWDYLGYTGTIALVLIAIQMITGLMLLFYYVPDTSKAFAASQAIRNDVPYGMLFSNIHSIGSNLILLIIFIHMFRIMIISAHRGPREPQWYTGAILLGLFLFTGFSGYLLPWSQQSYWACVIGTESVRAVPLIGNKLTHILRGGENLSGATLSRFFAFHVALLPITIIILIWVHVKSVWKVGVIAPPDMYAFVDEDLCKGCGTCEKVCSFNSVRLLKRHDKKLPVINVDTCNACRECVENCPSKCITFKSDKRQFLIEPIFPHNTFWRLKAIVATLIIFFFSVYFLHGLLMRVKAPANPLITPPSIKPEWYFLASYQLLRTVPNELWGIISIVAIVFAVLFLPKLDRSKVREPAKRPVYMFFVLGGIISFVILTIIGWFI